LEGELNPVFRKLTLMDWPCPLYEVNDIISCLVSTSKGICDTMLSKNYC
jgi:hypothetical protein